MFPREGAARWMAMIHIVLLAVAWLIPLGAYSELPDRIPIHFDAHGEPDGWSTKSSLSLWLMPMIATVMGVLFFVFLRFPQIYNHPRKKELRALPVELRGPVYDILREMLMAVALCLDVIMLYMIWLIIAGAKSSHLDLNWPVFVIIMIAPLGLAVYYIPRIGRTIDAIKSRIVAGGATQNS